MIFGFVLVIFWDQNVREHYLRDDIYCGVWACGVCDSADARLSESPDTILVLDTNVVLNQVGGDVSCCRVLFE